MQERRIIQERRITQETSIIQGRRITQERRITRTVIKRIPRRQIAMTTATAPSP